MRLISIHSFNSKVLHCRALCLIIVWKYEYCCFRIHATKDWDLSSGKEIILRLHLGQSLMTNNKYFTNICFWKNRLTSFLRVLHATKKNGICVADLFTFLHACILWFSTKARTTSILRRICHRSRNLTSLILSVLIHIHTHAHTHAHSYS